MAARKNEDQRRQATSKNSVGRTSAQAAKEAAARKERALKRSAARSAGRTRKDMAVPGKVTEAGVGNIPMTVARGVAAVAKAVKPKSSSAKPKPATPKPSKTAQERAKAAARVKKRENKRTQQAAKAEAKRREKLTPAQRTKESKEIQTAKDRMIKAEQMYKSLQSRSSGVSDMQLRDANQQWLAAQRAYNNLTKFRNPRIYGN